MDDPHVELEADVGAATWKQVVAHYQQPSLWRACVQLLNTLVPYVALWVGMYWTVAVSWWLTLGLASLAGLFLVRIFIIFHDCGHGSFFASRRANAVWGFITGLLTFTPFYAWRGEHAVHHGTTGDLDRREAGDVWTLTVEEYLAASRWTRFLYRLARNPIVLFVIAPTILFLIVQRFPRRVAKPRERNSIWWMNGALLLMVTGMSAIFGIVPYVLIQLTVMFVASGVGVWLFYLQHQFEDVYWERSPEWSYSTAALKGSSFLKLPKVLQWFSGNIGFHHVHHLNPRIPNYNLARCHESHPIFTQVKPMSLLAGLKSLGLTLWDESAKKLISFPQMRRTHRPRHRRTEPNNHSVTPLSASSARDPRGKPAPRKAQETARSR